MRPKREHATKYGQTYMVTTETWGRRALFRAEPWARLLIETLYHYRGTAYLLHAFVIMPDHLHVLITPSTSLEKAIQFIKGGFSYRAKRELGSNMEVWQKGFSDHRVRDAQDWARHILYIHQNPVRQGLCERPEQYPYTSAHFDFEVDDVPQGLKPPSLRASLGAAEAAPLQTQPDQLGAAEAAPLPNRLEQVGAAKGARAFKTSERSAFGARPRPFQARRATKMSHKRMATANDQGLTTNDGTHAQTH
jgi:putative transposase